MSRKWHFQPKRWIKLCAAMCWLCKIEKCLTRDCHTLGAEVNVWVERRKKEKKKNNKQIDCHGHQTLCRPIKQPFAIIVCVDFHREHFQMVNEAIIDHRNIKSMHKSHRWCKFNSIKLSICCTRIYLLHYLGWYRSTFMALYACVCIVTPTTYNMCVLLSTSVCVCTHK